MYVEHSFKFDLYCCLKKPTLAGTKIHLKKFSEI